MNSFSDLRRHRWVHHQRIGADRDVDDRREILGEIVGRRLADGDGERQARRRVEQRRAVGGRSDHRLAADDAGGARPVLDHELLMQALAEILREQPRHHVDAAAGGNRNHDLYRLVRVFGPRGEYARQQQIGSRATTFEAWRFLPFRTNDACRPHS